jgi:hypothetical protein
MVWQLTAKPFVKNAAHPNKDAPLCFSSSSDSEVF